MAASLDRHTRQSRSVANKAANRLCRDAEAYQMALNLINRRWREREAELGRDLLPGEVDELCDALSFGDVVDYIQTLALQGRTSC